MKKFLKTFAFLMVGLFVLAGGVDVALGHLSHANAQNSLIVYDDKGTAVFAYSGNMSDCKAMGKVGAVVASPYHFLHRT